MSDEMVNAQQLAKLSGESYDAIDHWSEKGLLVFNRRGRRRLYPREPNVQRVKRIRAMQDKGHSLDGIKDNLSGQK